MITVMHGSVLYLHWPTIGFPRYLQRGGANPRQGHCWGGGVGLGIK